MNQKREKLSRPLHIEDILQQVMASFRKDSAGDLLTISKQWKQAAGDVFANESRPGAIKDKKLIVYVSNSGWIQEFQFNKAIIIEKLNDIMGKQLISDIIFKIGNV